MSISISTTAFNSNYHSAQRAGSNLYGFYVFHNVDIYNEIKINGQTFQAIYQTGCSYNYSDYSCPSEHLSLSEAGGADEVLVKIYAAGDFDDSEESDAEELLEELKEDYSLTLTLEGLRAVYQAITDNQNMADQELKSMELSDDLDDYNEDEASGFLELKTVSDVAFGRLNENGFVCLFEKEEGEQLTRFEDRWPVIYPVNSGFSAHYDHPEGLVISMEDAKKLSITIEE